jgi:ATP-dependent exoDNAse (exonuclease V) beta subunit
VKVRVASAGTGKTTNLVARYLQLIGSGVPLRRIAGTTFTNLAAGELRQRVGHGLGMLLESGRYLNLYRLDPAARPLFLEAQRELGGAMLSTIHGFMISLLRLSAPLLGMDPEFSLLGEWEAGIIFEEELRSLIFLAQQDTHALHGALKLLGDDAQQLVQDIFPKRSLAERFLVEEGDTEAAALLALYRAALQGFEQRLGGAQLAPSEIERRSLQLVRTPAALRRVTERYHYVLVDEFQDVNPLQGAFFSALEATGGVQVEVVGDPKQSIYGFRNADVGVFRAALDSGEALLPLVETRRHAARITDFLNHATGWLAAKGLGFSSNEAPPVTAAGPQARLQGSVQMHWTTGAPGLAQLRISEARTLVRQLQELHRQGIAWSEMAVLARAHASLQLIEAALQQEGVPAVVARGRGYYERLEVRDVINALHAGISGAGKTPVFAAWLRSPFAQLSLHEAQMVLQADDPAAELARVKPEAGRTLQRTRELVLLSPLQALAGLLREPLVAGSRFVDHLDARQRANVDALLFLVASRPPGDLELLLQRLELMVRSDTAEVPQSGDGVQLVTIHSAKGLEWRVVALFDMGRRPYFPPAAVRVNPDDSLLGLQGSAAYEAAAAILKAREEQEAYRQFYVAVSRPREHLLLSASVSTGGRAVHYGWAALARDLGLGYAADSAPAGVSVQQHEYAEPAADAAPCRAARVSGLQRAEWSETVFPASRFPPVYSPSGLQATAHADEASGLADSRIAAAGIPPGEAGPDPDLTGQQGMLQEQGALPTAASAIGTLVHQGVAADWDPADPAQRANLLAQEVMFPFSADEQQLIVHEVLAVLGDYRRMLGRSLAPLQQRLEDHAELPVAFQLYGTIWQGTIDRLYQTEEGWFLEDYKTDRQVDSSRHAAQLGLYLKAVRQIWDLQPRVRLVYLRYARVVELQPGELLGQVRKLLA